MAKSVLPILCLLGAALMAPAQDVPKYYQDAAAIIGRKGALNADGSYRINIPRTDVSFVSSSGMPISADLGLATYIAFSGSAEKALAVGDVAMLEGEIDGVIDALSRGGINIVALHNHMTTEEPRLFFLHFIGVGTPEALATSFRSAIDVLGHGKERKPLPNVGRPHLDVEALTAVFGVKPQVFPSGVLRFNNPRKDISVSVDDMPFLPGMGFGSWAALNACECGQTMAMGDTCCVRSDLQAAIDALRKGGIHVTGIHNHILGGSREVLFIHFDGEGSALEMAKAIRSCWDVLGKT